MTPPDTCPNCGADVPRRARACPECGSDETTGWSEDAHTDRLGLPDDSFDYDEFVRNEFDPPRLKPRRVSWIWWLVAVLLLIAFVLAYVGR